MILKYRKVVLGPGLLIAPGLGDHHVAQAGSVPDHPVSRVLGLQVCTATSGLA